MQTYDYNGTPLCLVPHEPDNGYQLFVSFDGTIGLRVAPSGVETLLNALCTTTENVKIPSNANRKQRYLYFRNPWKTDENILVSHAVYLAWSGKPIPPGHQIHHLTGIVTDNRIENLVCLSIPDHRRYDAVQRSLRMAGRLNKMSPAEILEVTQQYVIDPCSTDEIMEYEMTHHMEI